MYACILLLLIPRLRKGEQINKEDSGLVVLEGVGQDGVVEVKQSHVSIRRSMWKHLKNIYGIGM
jgi:hypothetical protein